MGARQSMDERPRSNSVDTTAVSSSSAAALAPRGASRSVLTAADLMNAMRRGDLDDEGSDEDQPGPSRPPPYPRSGEHRRSHMSTGASGGGSGHRRGRLPPSALGRRSMPLFLPYARDMDCPICHKRVASDEAEVHIVMCFTRPKITYNEDVLVEGKGECSICLDEMDAGATIARLPCLCIYHKDCIDDWFKRKNCCPEHPGDD